MKARDIMTTKPVTIDSLATIAEAARVMKQNKVKALIVDRTSEQDAYGIITVSDIAQAIAKSDNPEKTYVCAVMTKPCIVVNPDLSVEYVAKLFAKAKLHIAPVIKDKLLGIISLTDILTKTNCFNPISASLISSKQEELASFFLDELLEKNWQIESDNIYENWCSG